MEKKLFSSFALSLLLLHREETVFFTPSFSNYRRHLLGPRRHAAPDAPGQQPQQARGGAQVPRPAGVLHDGLLGGDQRVRVVGVLVDVAVDDEVVGEHGADQDEAVERERGMGRRSGGRRACEFGLGGGGKNSLFLLSHELKKIYSPERHGERGQRAPGAPAAASREDADEGRDGREEQEAEDDVAFLFF